MKQGTGVETNLNQKQVFGILHFARLHPRSPATDLAKPNKCPKKLVFIYLCNKSP